MYELLLGRCTNKIPIKFTTLRSLLCALLFGFTVYGPIAQGDPLPGANDFQKVPIATGLANAVDFEFAPDGRIFILNRYGEIRVYQPATQTTSVAAQIAVYTGIEAGIMGIALDPQFDLNNLIYLYYSPPSPNINRLSRFHVNGDSVDLGSEIIMLDVPVDRQGGHHDGGNLEFDQFGNLYLGTGDDTRPGGYAALNENDFTASAEKSSANTMDLRGKILRIHPEADGSYSIPNGNLFSDPEEGRPEVYVMGARNPYKFSIDSATNWLFWGDIGPDANYDNADGPSGKDEINRTEIAGNFGWPHFIGPNLAYRNTYLDYYFDPSLPTNDSKWNTGPRELPAAQPAWITVPRAAYMAGPAYHFDNNIVNAAKLPLPFDDHFFYWDFNTSKVWYVAFDATTGEIIRNEPWDILTAAGQGYIDFEIGPDHQLYILEYGTGCCALDVGNGVLSRLDYVGEILNLSPVVKMSADNRFGSLPLSVNFSSVGTYDPDGDLFTVNWDFETDGDIDATSADATHTYTVGGVFNAQLKAIDAQGAFSVANMTIHAGNNIADIGFTWPPQGGMFEWIESVDASVFVNDVEDGSIQAGSIACTEVEIVPALGHLEHSHDLVPISNCKATVQFFSDHNMNGEDDLFYQIQASYLDNDGLESFKVIKVYPKRAPVEYNSGANAVQLIQNTDLGYGARNAIRALGDGSYIVFEKRSLSGINGVRYRVASGGSGGSIELRLDSLDGQVLETVPVSYTGAYNNWVEVQGAVTDPGDVHDLYFVFRGATSAVDLFDIVFIEFLGAGISYRTPPELTSLAVEPISRQLSPGNSVQFNATGYDQYGDVFPAAVVWSVSGGGSITTSGLFTSGGSEGQFDVIAQAGAISASAKVIVGDVNLALGAPVVASSVEHSATKAANAVDGDTSSRWSSLFSDSQWIYIDLGATYTIDRVVLNWEAAHGKTYEIQVSDDTLNWTTVFSESNGNGGIDDLGFTPVNSRYVRVMGLQRATQWGYSLWEFEVYGASTSVEPPVLTSLSVTPVTATVSDGTTQAFTATALDQYGTDFPTQVSWSVDGGGLIDGDGVFTATAVGGPFLVTATADGLEATAEVTVIDILSPPPGNLALGAPVVASSVEHSATKAANAVDGDTSSRWSSLFSDSQWIYIDLGATYTIDRVVLNWEAAHGKTYEIQVSDDTLNWTTVFSESNGNGGIDDLGFTPVNSRYVRVMGLQRATQWGYSLWEFEVYGASTSVEPPVLTSLSVTPVTATVSDGTTQAFTATALDQYGTDFPTQVSWSVDGGGLIDGDGVFTATAVGGPFLVTATADGLEATAEVTVIDILSPPPGNLALGAPVVASSVEHSATKAANAVDGDTSSRWSSLFSDSQWIYIDLGATYTIDRVVLNWEAAHGKTYEIQVSDDTLNWTTVFSESNGNGGIDDLGFTPVNSRYVRVMGLQRATQWGYSLWEFEVYGASTSVEPPVLTSLSVTPVTATVSDGTTQAFTATALDQYGTDFPTQVSWSVDGGGLIDGDGVFTATAVGGPFLVTATADGLEATAEVTVIDILSPPPGNLALGAPVVASSVEHSATKAANAVDGDTSSRWSSLFSDSQWIYIDLGATYTIDRVVLNWEAAHGKTYEIQVSDDTLNWTTVFSESNGNGGIDDLGFTPVNSRYVRVMGLQRATQWGYSLWEFEVYGAGNTTETWTVLPDSTVNRHESSLASVDGKIYLLGGRGSRAVEIFDPVANSWSLGASPPIELHHFQAVVWNQLIYVVGAFTGSYPTESSPTNVYIYDPTTDTWNIGPIIPQERRRGAAGAVVYNGNIYIVGGIVGGHGEHADSKPWLDRFDPATEAWSVLADMPNVRDHFGAAVVSDKLYAVAGRDSGLSSSVDNTVSAVDMYDFSTLSWTQLPAASDIPTERAGVAVAATASEIFVIGGEGFDQAWNTVEAFHVDNATWRTIAPIPTARHGMGATIYNGNLYVAGGSENQGGGPESTAFEALQLQDN